jgi:ATP-binding cassette, subfamily B, bacterial
MSIFSGKTAIVVSHRFSTVQAANRILVLSEGRIAESGTHDQLVQMDGVYAGLFALHSRST